MSFSENELPYTVCFNRDDAGALFVHNTHLSQQVALRYRRVLGAPPGELLC